MSISKKRKICVINGKRGGFNALIPTMQLISRDPQLKLQIILTDMHLSKKFGETIKDAKRWFKISRTVDFRQEDDSSLTRDKALGRGLMGIAQALSEIKPDLVLLLGDRSETLIAAFATLQLKIPIAHIQGGEISGNIDGIQRHAITKLSHLHFTETKQAAERVIKMGEEKRRVCWVGAPYIDFIKKKLYTPEKIVREKFGLGAKEEFFIVLYHPVTTEPEKSYEQMHATLAAVKAFKYRAILIYPCSDQGYQGVIDAIEEERKNPHFLIFKNIEAEDFIGLESAAKVLIGNSSASIYEAPYIYLAAVNIGKRQKGRERENNVIDVEVNKDAIARGIKKALFDKQFQRNLRKLKYIYGDGRACKRIVKVLKKIEINARFFEKKLTY